MAIADEKYVALTTDRKSGESSSTPVWVADRGDGTIGFATAGSSSKAKRIRNDPRVRLQPSDGRGRVEHGAEEVTGTAELLQGPGYERVSAAITATYGWPATLMVLGAKLLALVGRDRSSDTGVITLITLDRVDGAQA